VEKAHCKYRRGSKRLPLKFCFVFHFFQQQRFSQQRKREREIENEKEIFAVSGHAENQGRTDEHSLGILMECTLVAECCS
jgi:hypothetical protein